jgi:23S rRNA pseudouridine1911/1915/1917 synthase
MATNRGYVYRGTIDEAAAAGTLADYLSLRFRHSTREEWALRIERGSVTLDGRTVGPEAPLRPGQLLAWERPPWEEPAAPTRFQLLHEDADLLVVAKPAGLPTLPGGGFLENTLASLVRGLDPGAVPVHRLGRWTSGLVAFARTPAARRRLSDAWKDRAVGKVYRALATGTPAHDRFVVESPIGRVPYAPLGTLYAASPAGKPSRTEVEVRRRLPGRFLADVRPVTGRPHQIRIHLAYAGHPLCGDPLYSCGGAPAADGTALPGDPGYLLHAMSLAFPHPRTARECVFTCPPPDALR